MTAHMRVALPTLSASHNVNEPKSNSNRLAARSELVGLVAAPGETSPLSRVEEETISEWPEGRDLVIERQAGPGEDVEVEVIKNYYGEERSHKPKMTARVRSYVAKLKLRLMDH